MSTRSLPYLLVLGLPAMAMAMLLWFAFDEVVYHLLASPHWEAGSQEAQVGNERMLWMWDHTPFFLLTIYGFGLLIASRRR